MPPRKLLILIAYLVLTCIPACLCMFLIWLGDAGWLGLNLLGRLEPKE